MTTESKAQCTLLDTSLLFNIPAENAISKVRREDTLSLQFKFHWDIITTINPNFYKLAAMRPSTKTDFVAFWSYEPNTGCERYSIQLQVKAAPSTIFKDLCLRSKIFALVHIHCLHYITVNALTNAPFVYLILEIFRDPFASQ